MFYQNLVRRMLYGTFWYELAALDIEKLPLRLHCLFTTLLQFQSSISELDNSRREHSFYNLFCLIFILPKANGIIILLGNRF